MGSSKTGLGGTIGVTILNADGTIKTARATAGIYEIGGGCYGKQLTFDDNFKGSIKWDTGGGSPVYATEEYNYLENNPIVDELESRLTAARAGYLDNLSAGAVSLAATALTNATWTDAKAAFIDAAISGRAPANEYDTQMGYIPPNLGDVATAAEDSATHGAGSWEGAAAAPTVSEIRAEMEGAGYKLDRVLTATEIRQASVNDASASTTKFDTTLTEATLFWDRAAMRFTSGNNEGQMRRIKNYLNEGSGEITVQTPFHEAPANGDTFTIITVRAFLTPDIEDIADEVWDEKKAEHTDPTTFGGQNSFVNG